MVDPRSDPSADEEEGADRSEVIYFDARNDRHREYLDAEMVAYDGVASLVVGDGVRISVHATLLVANDAIKDDRGDHDNLKVGPLGVGEGLCLLRGAGVDRPPGRAVDVEHEVGLGLSHVGVSATALGDVVSAWADSTWGTTSAPVP